MNSYFAPVAGLYVAVETVVRNIEFATNKPLAIRAFPLTNSVPRLVPSDRLSCLCRPERFIVFARSVVQMGIRQQCIGLKSRARRELALLPQQVRNVW